MVKVGDTLVEKCRAVVNGVLQSKNKTWVLFQNQTFVILDEPLTTKEAASEKATDTVKVYGPFCAGTDSADFNVMEDKDSKGWIVTGCCEQMFTYVDEKQGTQQGGMMEIGLTGRAMRQKDGKNPVIIHVELGSNIE